MRRRTKRRRKPRKPPLLTAFRHRQVLPRHRVWHPSFRQSPLGWRHPISSNCGRHPQPQYETKVAAGNCTRSSRRSRRAYVASWVPREGTMSAVLWALPCQCLGMSAGQRCESTTLTRRPLTLSHRVQRKAGGVDVSLDVSELEGLSEEELRKRYDAQSRGSAGVPGQGPGREDFSDMVAKEMAKKRQKMEADRDRSKRDKGGRDFKF